MVKYIPEVCPNTNTCKSFGCPQLDSDIKYICDHWDISVMYRHDELVKKQIGLVKKWNKTIKSIPQIDEYTLRNIKMWRVRSFDLCVDFYCDDFSVHKLKSEARLLINRNFNLGFSEEMGVGYIIKSENNKFGIELWRHRCESIPLYNVTLNDAIDWIIDFHNNY